MKRNMVNTYSKILITNSTLLNYIAENTPKELQYEWLRSTYTQDRFLLVNNVQLYLNFLDVVLNRDLRELNVWINKNIVLQFGNMSEKTFDVRMRIATSMLNKCQSINDDKKREVHEHLIKRMSLEFYSVVNESLPF